MNLHSKLLRAISGVKSQAPIDRALADQTSSRHLPTHHLPDGDGDIWNELLGKGWSEREETFARDRDPFNLAQVGYLKVDAHGRIERANWRACSLLAEAPEYLLGMELSALVVPEDVPVLCDHLQYVCGHPGRHTCNLRVPSASGPLVLRVSSTATDNDAAGRFLWMALVDVTDYARLEAVARENLARAGAILEVLHDPVLTIDGNGKILSVNRATERVFGVSPPEVLGLHIEVLIPSLSTQGSPLPMARPSGQAMGRTKDGASFPVEVCWVGGADAASDGITLVVRDRSKDPNAGGGPPRWSDGMREVGKLAATFAHDFTNVLGGIQCIADSGLRNRSSIDDARSALHEIKQTVETGMAIVGHLATLMAPDGGATEEVPVDATIQRIAPLLGQLLGEQVEMTSKFSRSGASILAGPGHIEQIVINLALNARDAMPGGGTFRIETDERMVYGDQESPHVYVLITVSDTGTGMDEETLSRLFEPYFTTKGPLGRGLGLASVAATVKRLGGWIEVASHLGQGTVFTLYVPRHRRSMRKEAPASPEATSPVEHYPSGVVRAGERTRTVLIVDDDAPTRSVLKRLVQEMRCRVHTASGISEALRISEGEAIDMLLTDLTVSDGRGDVLAETLRAREPGLRVLFVSGWSLEGDATLGAALSHPRTKFLSKPVELDSLETTLSELFEDEPIAVNSSH